MGTELASELEARGVTHLLLTGVTTECCVASTMRTASDLGYRCILVEDACASPVGAFHEAAVAVAESIFAVVTRTESVLAAVGQ